MNKKLIATATGLVLAGGMGLANADVKLYGQLDLAIVSYDVDGGDDDVNMESTQSAIGVKGSEDLGNGMQALFQAEYQADIDDSGSWTGRDQFIGVQSEGFGKVTFGTMSTAYKSPGAKIDAFYRTPLQSRDIGLQSVLHKGKGEEGQGRATDTIRYDSPSWSGLSLTGTYTLDSGEADGEDDDPYSLGVQYDGYGAYVFASYITSNQNGDTDAIQIGGKYTMGDFDVHGIYEMDGGLITTQSISSTFDDLISVSGATDADCAAIAASAGIPGVATCDELSDFIAANSTDIGDGRDIWSIGATYTIGNNLIAADYGEGEDFDVNGLGEFGAYTAWRIAAYHKFSDRTRVYLGYSNTDVDDVGEADLFSLGMRHNF